MTPIPDELKHLKDDKMVQLLLAKIAENGCVMPKMSLIDCSVDSKVVGSNIDNHITICRKPAILQLTTLRHELVHSYDECLGRLNLNDPRSVACSEIRAMTMSGECFWGFEMLRGRFGGLHECVRRRALKSMGHPQHAFEGVNLEDVFDSVLDECQELVI